MSSSVIACDFEKRESQSFFYGNEAITNRIKINVEEAKVLSDIAATNETIIFLSDLMLEKGSDYGVKSISNKLRKDHIKIKGYLNDLAEKKLILLPNTIDKNEINELSKTDKNDFSKAYLNKVHRLLKSEILELEYLSGIANDVDFKVLTVKILVTLNYNLNQIQKNLKANY